MESKKLQTAEFLEISLEAYEFVNHISRTEKLNIYLTLQRIITYGSDKKNKATI